MAWLVSSICWCWYVTFLPPPPPSLYDGLWCTDGMRSVTSGRHMAWLVSSICWCWYVTFLSPPPPPSMMASDVQMAWEVLPRGGTWHDRYLLYVDVGTLPFYAPPLPLRFPSDVQMAWEVLPWSGTWHDWYLLYAIVGTFKTFNTPSLYDQEGLFWKLGSHTAIDMSFIAKCNVMQTWNVILFRYQPINFLYFP